MVHLSRVKGLHKTNVNMPYVPPQITEFLLPTRHQVQRCRSAPERSFQVSWTGDNQIMSLWKRTLNTFLMWLEFSC